MVRLNVFILIEESSRKPAILDIAMRLVESSLRDNGCIAYDAFTSISRDDIIMICETWKDEKALKTHEESEHFKTLVPQLKELGTMTFEKFDF